MTLDKELTKKLPRGWKIAYAGDNVVAIHPNHKPRSILIELALSTPFEKWEELKFYES